MNKPVDHAGRRFGRLTALQYIRPGKWRCLCDCGNERNISTFRLTSGKTASCGCLQRDRTTEFNRDRVRAPKGFVSYRTAHDRVKKMHGPARDHDCVDCGRKASDWSYIGGAPDEAWEVMGKSQSCMAYSPSPEFYVARCRTCHRRHDVCAARARNEIMKMTGAAS